MVEPLTPQQPIERPDRLAPLTAPPGSGSNPYGLPPGTGGGDIVQSPATPQSVAPASLGLAAYGHAVAAQVQAAMQRDEKLRYGNFAVELRLWVDSTGRAGALDHIVRRCRAEPG